MDFSEDACYRALTCRDARLDGRVFVGVKTTGIYCRPVCPARTPKRQNVAFYRSAAAAQAAGFRPCLRCRPESSPELGAWRGTCSTVQRALALIEAGALDDGAVDTLASRLGVGERQLRRLFMQHLGASPIAVAQTRRVLLAKQLLHDTQLPLAEVALAAGFGSVRRFNETFQTLYGQPPISLRRAGKKEVAYQASSGVRLKLPYRAPYDWSAMLAFLTARAIPSVEAVTQGRYARTLLHEGERGVVLIEPGADTCLYATLQFPRLHAWPTILARLRRVFDLVTDPAVICAHLAQDAALAPLLAQRPGLRAPGAWDGFEQAVRAVLGQQVSVSAARNLAATLCAAHGEPVDTEAASALGLSRLFPTPQRLLGADLSELGMPQARKNAIVGLATATVADPDLFSPKRSLDEAVAQLRALPGIGEWTAQYIAMRALREPDAFPHTDVALLRALTDKNGQRPSPEALLTRAEQWRPWRAYAASHLWAADAATREEPSTLLENRHDD